MQLNLFNKRIRMNNYLFNLFIIANGADYERDLKQSFYKLKNILLTENGTYLGYYKQIIKSDCWTCGGTGEYIFYDFYTGSPSGYDTCNKCDGSGVHHFNYYYLKTYSFYGKIFHLPVYDPPQTGELGVIKGHIQHEIKCSKNKAKYAAMILLLVYLPRELKNYLKWYVTVPYSHRLINRIYYRLNNGIDWTEFIENHLIKFDNYIRGKKYMLRLTKENKVFWINWQASLLRELLIEFPALEQEWELINLTEPESEEYFEEIYDEVPY